jgi:site-specific DNA-methyltransferase (cytosine-N4-specific)
MKPLYTTSLGEAYVGDSLKLLDTVKKGSVNLLITSPPFALQRKKEYGNVSQDEYVNWLATFATKAKEVLRDDGSFVLDLGGAYQSGRPIRSLYNFKVLIKFCEEVGFNLSQEFFWYNPSKLPSPIEWVNKKKIRAKDAVNTVWWFSKTDFPKADIRKVLSPYSDRMKKLLKSKGNFYTPKVRPSGHSISGNFNSDNGGAIPPNLLQIPHSESNSQYLRYCRIAGVQAHPARFPKALPDFFIKFLTDPGDTVLDIFAGSNTTGESAQENGRKWIAFDNEKRYLAASAFRFLNEMEDKEIIAIFNKLMNDKEISLKIAQQSVLAQF